MQEIIYALWEPITSFYDGEVGRDWIAHPKINGYQSLHTTIKISDKIIEVQIRTHDMHEVAEFGTAAVHWRYKDHKLYRKGKIPRATKTKDLIWSEQLGKLRANLNNAQVVNTHLQQGFLKDHIFVITPEGHVIDLAAHATPLDFAYRIHTDLGHGYSGAKVGDHLVHLDYELKNGDIVELMPPRGKGPSPEWLSMSKDEDGKRFYLFARTRQARSKIRNWLNKYNEEYKAKHSEAMQPKQIEVQKPKTSK